MLSISGFDVPCLEEPVDAIDEVDGARPVFGADCALHAGRKERLSCKSPRKKNVDRNEADTYVQLHILNEKFSGCKDDGQQTCPQCSRLFATDASFELRLRCSPAGLSLRQLRLARSGQRERQCRFRTFRIARQPLCVPQGLSARTNVGPLHHHQVRQIGNRDSWMLFNERKYRKLRDRDAHA